MAMGRRDEAVAHFAAALDGCTGTTADHFDFGVILHGLGRLSEAAEQFKASTGLPDASENTSLNLARTRLKLGESVQAVAAFDESLRRGAGLDARSDRLFALNYVPDLSEATVAEEHFREGAAFGREVRGRGDFESLRAEPGSTPIRLGILSPDLRSHPIGWFLRPLLPRLRAMGFELLAYSSTPSPDAVTAELRAACSTWHECLGAPDSKVEADAIADRPHVLLDLSGHTARNRMPLVARRLAPVQIQWIGYPNTTGVGAVDHAIGDPIETPPESHPFFSEKVVTMPDAYVCYVPHGSARESPRPSASNGHVTFGSLNNPSKIHPGVLEAWATILRGVPGSRLLLRYQTYADPRLCARYAAFFDERGIDPDRLELIAGGTPEEAIATYERIDLALDTFPYSGGLTTCESVSRGVPVVALRGRGFAGRHSATHLSNAGLGDWVTEDLDRYVALAIERASEPSRLETLRKRLPAELSSTPLGDADRFARHFAEAIRLMVAQWRDGTAPQAIAVPQLA